MVRAESSTYENIRNRDKTQEEKHPREGRSPHSMKILQKRKLLQKVLSVKTHSSSYSHTPSKCVTCSPCKTGKAVSPKVRGKVLASRPFQRVKTLPSHYSWASLREHTWNWGSHANEDLDLAAFLRFRCWAMKRIRQFVSGEPRRPTVERRLFFWREDDDFPVTKHSHKPERNMAMGRDGSCVGDGSPRERKQESVHVTEN